MVTLVEAPRGLDMPVGSVALVDADDVRLGLAVGRRFRGPLLPAGRRRRRRGALAGTAVRRNRARARGHLRQGTLGCGGPAGRRARHRGRGRRAAGAVGIALPTRQPRLRAPWRPRRPAPRLGHRPVRARPVDRRPHPRDDQHRGRAVARARVLGVQRRSRRTAPVDDPRPRRASRTSGVDRSVGHLRRVARRRRRRPCRRASRVGSAPAPRGRYPPACDRMRVVRRRSRARSGCSRAPRRWPTTPRTFCAAERCWRPESWRGLQRRRRPTRCGCRNCSGSPATTSTSPRSRANWGSPPMAGPRSSDSREPRCLVAHRCHRVERQRLSR